MWDYVVKSIRKNEIILLIDVATRDKQAENTPEIKLFSISKIDEEA